MERSEISVETFQDLVRTLSAALGNSGSTALPKEPFKLDIKTMVEAYQIMLKVPASKSAVLECFGAAYDSSVHQCLINKEKKSEVTTQYTIADELTDLLKTLIPNRGWASVLSTWCIRILGQVSSKYASFINNVNLDEIMNFWMTCPPTKHLIEMMSECLKNMVYDEADSCINALLETLIDYNPHFDWVVAYMGNSFPETVISRILSVGLFDFVGSHKSNIAGESIKSNKVNSAIHIVCYLAVSNLEEVENGILQLYKLYNPGSAEITDTQMGVIPFLLHMSTASPFMADIVSKVITTALAPTSFDLMCQKCPWVEDYYGSADGFKNFISNVIFRLDSGAWKVLNLALRLGGGETRGAQSCRDFVSYFMAQTFKRLHGSRPSDDFPVLSALAYPWSFQLIISNLLCEDVWKRELTLQLITLITTYRGGALAREALSHVLVHSETEEQLVLFHEIVKNAQPIHCDLVTQAVADSVGKISGRKRNSELTSRIVENLSILLCWEKGTEGKRISAINLISRALSENLAEVLKLLNDESLSIGIQVVSLIKECGLAESMSEATMACVAEVLLPLFFVSLDLKEPLDKAEAVVNIQFLLSRLCRRAAVQSLVLRRLLEAGSSEKFSVLLGKSTESIFHHDKFISLLEKNLKYASAVTELHGHKAVLHSGVIGKGPRTVQAGPNSSDDEDIKQNIDYFIETLSKCCVSQSGHWPTTDGMSKVAMILLEHLSPDVMYNGLPWPEEEFVKVTIERDLAIKRGLETQPVMWEILRLLALNRPALCYCSVLLRAPLGILISQWASEQERPERLPMTCKLLDLMSLGQLLPPPLTMVSEILPMITQQEATLLLRDICNYMRENVPAPALFVKDSAGNIWRDFKSYHIDSKYTDRLRRNFSHIVHLALDMRSTLKFKFYASGRILGCRASSGHSERYLFKQCLQRLNQRIDSLTRTLAKKGRNIADEES